MRLSFIILFFIGMKISAQSVSIKKPTIQDQVWALTEVMYHDIINPPAAARFYAYSLLTGYEILSQTDSSLSSLNIQLKYLPQQHRAFNRHQVNIQLAALYGILETGKNIIPSGYLLEEKQKELLNQFKYLPGTIKDFSVILAKRIATEIVEYSKTDGYFKLSTFKRYKPFAAEGTWQPTPPEYMAPVEPNWNTIRPFFIDSLSQCVPDSSCIIFSKDTSSPFYLLSKEVYTTNNNLTTEEKWIADFWDCNPFAVQFQGHMSIGLKKISPGGHWMGITGIVCEKAKLNFGQTMLLHTLIALTLHDAFISCWSEKYKYNRIRPETAINRYIDEKWKPYLQTPPFPEYPSGHSVISTASAEILTFFLGDHFAFTDSTENYIGIPPRKFTSFKEAAAEARISRLYGGIHFRDAIENGAEEGKKLSQLILHKLNIGRFR